MAKRLQFETVCNALERSRWVFLDSFSPDLGKVLLAELKKAMNSVGVAFIEAAEDFDAARTVQEERPAVLVVDALHASELSQTSVRIKKLLSRWPETKFVFLGSGNLRAIEIPDYLGRGMYFDCEREFGVPASTNDAELLKHSRRIQPRYQARDLILGPLTNLKFQEAVSYIRTKDFVENEWGFREKHTRGHGVTLLFHGASGTGKTMAAEVIATELELPLYQIDLSSVISKWVGETEKNLKAIFRAARGVQGILLFDEGDAIFGSRTETKTTQDKYGNLEVNYLLQEIESFPGISIISTNHASNLDPAFLRRFTHTIIFSPPSRDQRVSIWKANVPKKMPLDSSVDFEALAQFALTGGNIKNCLRDAAARAAHGKARPVSQVDLLWSIKRELQKHGKELNRELVGETYWRSVATEWEAHWIRKSERSKEA